LSPAPWARRPESVAQVVRDHAQRAPDRPAFVAGAAECTWRDYTDRADRVATLLVDAGFQPGERVAVWLPDGPGVHAVWLGAERAGLVVVGIGPRAGERELRHLLSRSGAVGWVSQARHRGLDATALARELIRAGALRRHVVVDGEREGLCEAAPLDAGRALGVDDLFLLNSTSGTTGLPKLVTHDQRRWYHFHDWAVAAGDLREDDVFLSALPAPFGFGIWTSHVTPTLLGAPTVLLPRFDARALANAIERYRVTVLAAVTTQFVLLLESGEAPRHDFSSLRVLFTGGEAVPYERAARFEDETGARVLQFYGSNETGALSRTTLTDDRDVRLRTAGHVIPEMAVRLFDDEGRDVTATGRGQPGCRGPATSRGYFADAAANAELYTPDGWMLTGDVAELDDRGVLKIVGRKADFIIRGGKNVSGPVVEAEVATHPGVALVAAVARPDPVFGERVCVYVQPRAGAQPTLEDICAHLRARGVSVESLPEFLVVVDELPRASGGKVAKQTLREDLRRRMAAGE
jgi:acyl-CoA synthetase